tara:strand:- start:496 stop:717 length:222 start_codon:yes stop_codon:yes gene_type:complete
MTDKHEQAYEEWVLMEEPMGSFQAFIFAEYQKALEQVKRLRKELNRIYARYEQLTDHWTDEDWNNVVWNEEGK